MKPDTVNIFGKIFKIIYCKEVSAVDSEKRNLYFGQLDAWNCNIRVFDNGERPEGAIFETIMHEILHAISVDLNLDCFDGDKGHDELQLVAMALADILTRNNWLKDSTC